VPKAAPRRTGLSRLPYDSTRASASSLQTSSHRRYCRLRRLSQSLRLCASVAVVAAGDCLRFSPRFDRCVVAGHGDRLATGCPGSESSERPILRAIGDESLAATVREADDWALKTGFRGTHTLLDALVEYGCADLAYGVVSRTALPGWIYRAEQGATTVRERRNTDRKVGPGMHSRNHAPSALASEFFSETLAGIRRSAVRTRKRRVDVSLVRR